MGNFLKYTLASILGIIIGSFILVFITGMFVSSAIQSAENDEVSIKENTILYLNFDKPIVDRAVENPLEMLDIPGSPVTPKMGLVSILENIEKAKDDDNISGIYLDLTTIPAGAATLNEIRDALLDFKTSGKFIYSYANYYTQSTFYLATAADSVFLNPEGEIAFVGLNAQIAFLKNMLEKIGVQPEIIRHGKFKSAIEPLIRENMSEANRLQTEKYVGSIWLHYLKGIAAERDISVDRLNQIADDLLVKNAKSTVELGLVDALKYKDEILNFLKEKTNIDYDDDLESVSLSKYNKVPKVRKINRLAKDKIAVIYASGSIIMGKGDNETIGSERISRAIRKARRDSSIKAIVLRVNSPGGSALASDIIWREMVLAQKAKPTVVSMGDVAASGGYYIACAADRVIASPNTITGSIGVFGVLFNAKSLFNETLGITFDGVKTNKHADIGTQTRPLSQDERAYIQQGVEEIYDTFISHVAEGRKKEKADIDSIGQGRVWSGANAKEIGLIDEFGGLKHAIDVAVEMAKLENYRVVSLPEIADPVTEMLKKFTGDAKIKILQEELGSSYRYYKQVQALEQMQGIQARMLYSIELY